jgi:hypothetical protein
MDSAILYHAKPTYHHLSHRFGFLFGQALGCKIQKKRQLVKKED